MEITIPKNIETSDSRDFYFLREKGLEYIRDLSHQLWTDHNIHDPGITLLEAVCYAITDLGHRIHLPIRDLLTETDKDNLSLESRFPTPKKILTTGPITVEDYRKLFVDIQGVHNAFIRKNKDWEVHAHCLKLMEPNKDTPSGKLSYKDELENYENHDSFVINGLYNVLFEPDPELEFLEAGERQIQIEEIKKNIRLKYHSNRNLCEDLVEVREIEITKILVCGDILLEFTADPIETLAEILFRIEEYLSPTIKRYSLQQLMDEDYPIQDIFDGPVLEKGFIKSDELKKADIKTEIRLSDLVQIIMGTPGVTRIENLGMSSCESIPEDTMGVDNLDKWVLCFKNEENKALRLCLDQSIRLLNLFKDVIPIDINESDIKQELQRKRKEFQTKTTFGFEGLAIEKGRGVLLGEYYTIQNDLPQIYGTGRYGLSSSLPKEKHALALQLKGYLLFFDQILASYFACLEDLKTLLSFQSEPAVYSTGTVLEVKDLIKLLKSSENYKGDLAGILDRLDDSFDRKNKLLDHLLARFSEDMNRYVFALKDSFGENYREAALWHKAQLLEEYPEFSYRRAQGFNYYKNEEVWDTENIPGVKQKLAHLLGFFDHSRRNLTLHTFDIIKESETPETWIWTIANEESEVFLKGNKTKPSRVAAEHEMWTLMHDLVNSDNYKIEEDDEEFTIKLVDPAGNEYAFSASSFSTEKLAEEALKNFIDYLEEAAFREGMFVFEHLLFRPERTEDDSEVFMEIKMNPDCDACEPLDPYSFRITIVLPGWFGRFANSDYRKHAEKVIRSEIPAHILTRICWIGHTMIPLDDGEKYGTLARLEDTYHKWLIWKMSLSDENEIPQEIIEELLRLLNNLKTVYPEGRLFDCSMPVSGPPDNKIILGRTKLGELKNEDYEHDE